MTDLRKLSFEQLLIYIAVVETGSLTRAAERLGIGKTAVGKHVQRLEDELGTTLIARTTRRIHVTEAGASFFEAARRLAELADEAVSSVNPAAETLRGTLRVAASVEFSAIVLAPVLAAMREAHPELRIEMVSGDRFIDMLAKGVDVAIRLGELADSSLRAVTVGKYEKWLVASPAWLARHRLPGDVAEAAGLPFVGLSVLAHPLRCQLRKAGGETLVLDFAPGLLADTMYACRAAAAEGAGLAWLPDFTVHGDIAAGRLVRVHADWAGPEMAMHALLPPGRHTPPKVRALIDRLKAHLAQG
ncbi:LysR family transcriptional regulator [Burkholderia gladioli]|uniref:LysR family transcriptional regulator n=1 Tax=Burkholderia gladioli TaxID=28095 RepID=UPI0016414BC9|nr:LysR family transcriptional regulator [Burkholderia gladioli]